MVRVGADATSTMLPKPHTLTRPLVIGARFDKENNGAEQQGENTEARHHEQERMAACLKREAQQTLVGGENSKNHTGLGRANDAPR